VSTKAVSQLDVPGQKIGMKMSQENVANGPSIGIGFGNVLIDVALGIHNGSNSGSLVRNQVRGV
jgi:hypothetical protein